MASSREVSTQFLHSQPDGAVMRRKRASIGAKLHHPWFERDGEQRQERVVEQ